MINENEFPYGTHYWRPPYPARFDHRANLSRIKNEHGMNLVKFRIGWNWHHRRPDEFYFDEVNELFDICDELGLNVLLELFLESAPYWLELAHPESRYVNANGRAIELGAQEATPGGGHPGLCFHHDVVKRHGERFIRAVAREFRDRKSLYIYDCWNEPHLEPAWCNNMWGNMGDKLYCYCEESRKAFRRRLRGRYGDIERFNNAWGRAYTDFEQVNPPILGGTYADWLDWMRFWFDELHEFMRWRVNVLKEEDPDRMVASHSGATPPVHPRANAYIHNWKFAEPVDIWGCSFAAQAFNWDMAVCAQVIELTRSAARGKRIWISEMPQGAANIRGFRASRRPRPEDFQLWNAIGSAFGSTGTIGWSYLPTCTGQEAGHFGMVRLNGRPTERTQAIVDAGRLQEQCREILLSASVPTQVAILYEPDNSALLFAMELEDKLYGRSHQGYYRAVWKSDLAARYVTSDTLDDVEEKVLILPMALVMSEATADKIAEFVRSGGTLITEARTGMFDEHGFIRGDVPPGRLAGAAGLTEGEMIYSDPANVSCVPTADAAVEAAPNLRPPDAVYQGPPIAFRSPVEVKVPAHGYLAPLELNGAEPIGACGEMILAAHHRFGKGQVYYFGTYMGLALDSCIPGALALIRRILLEQVDPVVAGKRLRPRVLRRERKTLLYVFNEDLRYAVSEAIRLPEGFDRATNMVTKEEYEVVGGGVTLTVAPESAAVLLLEEK